MNCEYINDYYGLTAYIGQRVSVSGKPGIIAEDRGNYIGVNFDSDKPGEVSNCHPTWKVEYLGPGKIRKMTRSQQRYREWRLSEVDETFPEWMGFSK